MEEEHIVEDSFDHRPIFKQTNNNVRGDERTLIRNGSIELY